MWGSYFWLDTTRLYTQWSWAFQRKDRLSHYQKLTSLSAFGSILKGFLGTDVGKCEGCTFGWTRLYTRPHVELETLRAWVVCNGYGQRGYPIPLSNNDMQTKVRRDRTWFDSIYFITTWKIAQRFSLDSFWKDTSYFWVSYLKLDVHSVGLYQSPHR